jgi:hypothetical protein
MKKLLITLTLITFLNICDIKTSIYQDIEIFVK